MVGFAAKEVATADHLQSRSCITVSTTKSGVFESALT